jgi:hypothetical protein
MEDRLLGLAELAPDHREHRPPEHVLGRKVPCAVTTVALGLGQGAERLTAMRPPLAFS